MDKNVFEGDAARDLYLMNKFIVYIDRHNEGIRELLRDFFRDHDSKETRVIEIGCGLGRTTREILAADRRNTVTAVDASLDMIRGMQNIFTKEIKQGRLRPVHSDGKGFVEKQDNDSYDAFVSGFTLHNFERNYRRDFLKAVYRILKRGGFFVNADKIAIDDPEQHKRALEWEIKQLSLLEKEGKGNLAEEWIKHYKKDESEEIVMKESEFVRQLEGFGFRDIRRINRKNLALTVTAVK
jgi:ubiquinone/menaquinone biosynthesis C-methylase UbiE